MNRISPVLPAVTAILATVLAAQPGCSSSAGSSGSGASSASSTSSSTSSASSTSSSSSSTGTGGTTSSSTTGTGGSSTSSTSSGTAGSCSFTQANACPTGQYCDAPDCKTGTCQPLGVEAGDKAAVCGCDGVTYWNDLTASSHGMSVAKVGACAPGKACGGAGNVMCAAGQSCNLALTSQTDCTTANPSGVCWGMPTTCPDLIGFGGQTYSDCDPSGVYCGDECTIIQAQKPWFTDNCPM